jgi:peptidoglycan/LPS O-acetylase OafA/YrhL
MDSLTNGEDLEIAIIRSNRMPGSAVGICLAKLIGILSHLGIKVLPTWLRLYGDKPTRPSSSLRRTAYLGGLRGLVVLFVFIRHFSLPWQPELDYGYGYRGHNGLLRLPFARLSFSGPLVPIFFIVTGYVLSGRTLELSRKSEWDSLLLGLSGSTFRRSMRLLLPPILSTFGVCTFACLGLFSFPYESMPGRIPVHPETLESPFAQLAQWASFVWSELTNPWRWDVPPMLYGPHLWTIPISLKGSLVVFLVCVAIARVKTDIRLFLLIALSVSTLLHSRWDIVPFLNGIILRELDTRWPAKCVKHVSKQTQGHTVLGWISRVATACCFLVGLYVGSFPRFNAHGSACVEGFRWLCQLTPNYRYWHDLSASMILLAVSREKILQQPLECSFIQYLGSISFSMFIVHEPFLHLYAFYTIPFFLKLTGEKSMVQYQTGFIMAMVVSLFYLVWIADLFKRYVEDSCERFSGYIEKQCLVV